MTLAFAEQLEEAGVASLGAAIDVLHEYEGPSGITGSCAVAGGYAWLERRSRAAPDRDRALVAALRGAVSVAEDADVRAYLPFVTATGVAVYASLPGAGLLVDPLLLDDDAAAAAWQRLSSDCARLGRYLARLHDAGAIAQDGEALARAATAMVRVDRLVRRSSGPQPRIRLEQLQEFLLCTEPDLTQTLVGASAAYAAAHPRALLHGQFSPAFVVRAAHPADPRLAVIGWLEAGVGPRAFDVGTFVGELAELSFTWLGVDAGRSAALDEAAAGFVREYVAAAAADDLGAMLADISLYSAVKIVDHLRLHTDFFGFHAGRCEPTLAAARAALNRDWTAVV